MKKEIVAISLLFTALASPVQARSHGHGHHGHGHSQSSYNETPQQQADRLAREAAVHTKLAELIAKPSTTPQDLIAALGNQNYEFFNVKDAEYLNEARKDVLGDTAKAPSPLQAAQILQAMHRKSESSGTLVGSIFIGTLLTGGALASTFSGDDKKKAPKGKKESLQSRHFN